MMRESLWVSYTWDARTVRMNNLTRQLSLSNTAPLYPAFFNAGKSIWRISSYPNLGQNYLALQEKLYL